MKQSYLFLGIEFLLSFLTFVHLREREHLVVHFVGCTHCALHTTVGQKSTEDDVLGTLLAEQKVEVGAWYNRKRKQQRNEWA